MRVHIIGAGLAGLAAAVRLDEQGHDVVIYEATDHGGGRCRSFFDDKLQRRIDNGNHLLLSGNVESLAYVKAIGALDTFQMPDQAVFPFMDLENDERWKVLPWRQLRVPGCSALGMLTALKLPLVDEKAVISDVFKPDRPLTRKFWDPLSIAILNTASSEASARLMWPVMKQIFLRGEKACRPMIAKLGLSESLIDPALKRLKERGQEIQYNKRLKALNFEEQRISGLSFSDEDIEVQQGDRVILAVPPHVASTVLSNEYFPNQFRAIVNAHFVLPDASHDGVFLGLVGGISQWLFVRGEVASITISAADDLVDRPSEELADTLWPEVVKALDLENVPMGAYRILKEKRATFAQTPNQVRLRPAPQTRWNNLLLAGDWTDTGLPATMEGAIASGHRVAGIIASRQLP